MRRMKAPSGPGKGASDLARSEARSEGLEPPTFRSVDCVAHTGYLPI